MGKIWVHEIFSALGLLIKVVSSYDFNLGLFGPKLSSGKESRFLTILHSVYFWVHDYVGDILKSLTIKFKLIDISFAHVSGENWNFIRINLNDADWMTKNASNCLKLSDLVGNKKYNISGTSKDSTTKGCKESQFLTVLHEHIVWGYEQLEHGLIRLTLKFQHIWNNFA